MTVRENAPILVSDGLSQWRASLADLTEVVEKASAREPARVFVEVHITGDPPAAVTDYIRAVQDQVRRAKTAKLIEYRSVREGEGGERLETLG